MVSFLILRYEGVSKSFRTGRLERELQTVQLSATKCSCIAILWVSLVIFVAITLYVASQRMFIVVGVVVVVVVVYFCYDSVRKLLDTPSYMTSSVKQRKKLNIKIILIKRILMRYNLNCSSLILLRHSLWFPMLVAKLNIFKYGSIESYGEKYRILDWKSRRKRRLGNIGICGRKC
jgi:hypothetical protein